MLSPKQCDWRCTNWPSTAHSCRSGLRRPDPCPDELAGKAQRIEPVGIIVCHPGREYLQLPGGGWGFKTLELFRNCCNALRACHLFFWCCLLPGKQEAHKV